MKDNLRSENKKYMSNDINCKQRIKLWDWVVHFKDLNAFFKIVASQFIKWDHNI